MFSRRNFLKVPLAGASVSIASSVLSLSLLAPAAAQVEVKILEVVKAIGLVYESIQDRNFSSNTTIKLDQISQQLDEIDAKLDIIIEEIRKLPSVIQNLLIAQYQQEQIGRARAIGRSIFQTIRLERPPSDTLRSYANELVVSRNLIDDFGNMSSPWVAQCFAYEALACRFMRDGKEIFQNSKAATKDLIDRKATKLGTEISKQDGIIVDLKNFCSANERTFVGWRPSLLPGVPDTINYYILLHNCNEVEFQVRLEGSMNPRKWKVSPIWPDAEKGSLLTENPHEVRKEAFNTMLRRKQADSKAASELRERLTAAKADAERLSRQLSMFVYRGITA